MKKKLFITLAVVVLVSLGALPALASQPENVWCYLPTELEVIKTVGGNTFYHIVDEGAWTGIFTGTSVDSGTTMFHPNGNGNYDGWVSFASVEVAGKSGGLEMRVTGSIPKGDAGWFGYWVILNGTGELAGLHGQGTWWGPGWNPGNPTVCGHIDYAGNIHFEP